MCQGEVFENAAVNNLHTNQIAVDIIVSRGFVTGFWDTISWVPMRPTEPPAVLSHICRYELQHLVRTHMGSDDESYNCISQQEDSEGIMGIKLDRVCNPLGK